MENKDRHNTLRLTGRKGEPDRSRMTEGEWKKAVVAYFSEEENSIQKAIFKAHWMI